MRVNQRGEEVEETTLFPYGHAWEKWTPEELAQAVALLCQHAGVEIVRTNATKHGNAELVLRPTE